jgi:hypothetical protein
LPPLLRRRPPGLHVTAFPMTSQRFLLRRRPRAGTRRSGHQCPSQ